MKTISAIDEQWIEPYLSKTKNVDVFKLAGLKFETKITSTVEEES